MKGEPLMATFAAGTPDPADCYERAALSHTLHACLDLLDRRERLVVRAYFGLDDQEPQTLEQIGMQYGPHARASAPTPGRSPR